MLEDWNRLSNTWNDGMMEMRSSLITERGAQ